MYTGGNVMGILERDIHYNTINLNQPLSQMNILSLSVPEGDNSHSINLLLIKDGVPYHPIGAYSAFWVGKTTGSCTLVNGRVQYDLTLADTAEKGLVEAEIRMYDQMMSHPPLPYDATKEYAEGDWCTHNGKYYQALIPVTGAWDADMWDEVDVGVLVTPKIYVNVI
jgi:hypothetical protein